VRCRGPPVEMRDCSPEQKSGKKKTPEAKHQAGAIPEMKMIKGIQLATSPLVRWIRRHKKSKGGGACLTKKAVLVNHREHDPRSLGEKGDASWFRLADGRGEKEGLEWGRRQRANSAKKPEERGKTKWGRSAGGKAERRHLFARGKVGRGPEAWSRKSMRGPKLKF